MTLPVASSMVVPVSLDTSLITVKVDLGSWPRALEMVIFRKLNRQMMERIKQNHVQHTNLPPDLNSIGSLSPAFGFK